MANVTKLPTLKFFQWSRPNAANPRLAAAITSTATTLTFTNPPLDETDAVVSTDFLMGIKNNAGYTETIYVPVSGLSVDGLTATGVTRGIDLSGLDFTTGDANLAAAHEQDSQVFCNISALHFTAIQAAQKGQIASGGENWRIGNEADNNITVTAANGDANEPFWRYDSATSQWVFSNDGVSTTPFGTGAGVTGGDGITVTAGDIDIDTTDTTIFVETTAGAGDSGKVAKLDASGLIKQANVEIWKDVTSTAAELNKLDGAGATVTAANLTTLTDGSDSDALHTHALLSQHGQAIQTYAFSALPTSFQIAHGLGKAPTYVKVTTYHNKSSTIQVQSIGTYKGGVYNNFYTTWNSASPPTWNSFSVTTGTISQMSWNNTGSADDIDYTMTISSIDATNINFAISRTLGTVTGNIWFLIEFSL